MSFSAKFHYGMERSWAILTSMDTVQKDFQTYCMFCL